ncbi:MAG: hypothetical protein ACFE96_01950 [Candidatus Hermodarchaeota archaeon]
MDIRNDELLKIIEKYPKVVSLEEQNYHLLLKLNGGILLEINFRKYPKKLKAFLINDKGEKFKLGRVVSSLRDWKREPTPFVVDVIDEILLLIKNLKLNQILIKKEFLEVLIDMCQKKHPLKMRGILGVHKGAVSEFVLPSRPCSDATKDIQFLGTVCSLPLDFSYEGTFISRPTGDLSINEKLTEIFKKRRFTMLLAYPYNRSDCIKCFDTSGAILEHIIIN